MPVFSSTERFQEVADRLEASDGLATGEDHHCRDLFDRFNQTFQEYCDTSAGMDRTSEP